MLRIARSLVVLWPTPLCVRSSSASDRFPRRTYASRFSTLPEEGSEVERMQTDYNQTIQACNEHALLADLIDPRAVFVNNEVKLERIQTYGFDYDYTLATYTPALDEFIFNEARDWMVRQMKYPDDLMGFCFKPNFLIRGLHYDVIRGYIMKVDAFHYIQMDTVHRGFTQISQNDVLEAYPGTYIPSQSLRPLAVRGFSLPVNISSRYPILVQLMDFFMLPEFYLLCCIIEFFDRRHISYKPLHVYQDVTNSISRVHKSGLLGLTIMGNPEKYIRRDPDLSFFLNKLAASGKKLFVISNSSAAFIDRGLRFLIGDNWRDLFDVTISRANKPDFFTLESSQFRHMDERGKFKSWGGVKSLHKGHIYEGGSLTELMALTGWNAQNILYFGDHVYSDLADVANTQGWTTAAVIPELEHEINVISTAKFSYDTERRLAIERLIDVYQHVKSPEAKTILDEWRKERNQLRYDTKVPFNEHFGSIFRSIHNPSYFNRRLSQYAVLYTSRVANLLRYPIDHIFYPKRRDLPHETVH
ncbi:unnamed protein product [Calicophoron daubneyi]|uniref:5'-nucleotidase domain-containing protein 3 n=1 Tax=Calicophoron daubneyi TaxID=300641 RepID=A0AAV2TWE0_CALDB